MREKLFLSNKKSDDTENVDAKPESSKNDQFYGFFWLLAVPKK